MGAYLDTPVKDKNPEQDTFKDCWWGACAMQGWRCNMEDAHCIFELNKLFNHQLDEPVAVFGVFDGHGGKEVADFCKAHFQDVFKSNLLKNHKGGDYTDTNNYNYEQTLKQTFNEIDNNVKHQEYAEMTGSTACVVVVMKDSIYCANSGDSRAVLCRNSEAVELSFDHKPDNDDELARIEQAGHFVEDGRVDGNLALSRAIGDYQYKDKPQLPSDKQAVTCDPQLIKRLRDRNTDAFIIVACDGIWDCKKNQECVDFLKPKLSDNGKNCEPLEQLLDDCLAKNTEDGIGTDNMTAVLVNFKQSPAFKKSR